MISDFRTQNKGKNVTGSARRARRARALKIVYACMAMSGGVAFIPFPLLDQVLIGGLIAKMIQDVSALYGVPLADHKAKAVLAAVLGGAHAEWISRYSLFYIENYLPGLTRAGRLVTRPIISAATAYAVGMLFVHHFDQGAWRRNNAAVQPDSGFLPRSAGAGGVDAARPRSDS